MEITLKRKNTPFYFFFPFIAKMKAPTSTLVWDVCVNEEDAGSLVRCLVPGTGSPGRDRRPAEHAWAKARRLPLLRAWEHHCYLHKCLSLIQFFKHNRKVALRSF